MCLFYSDFAEHSIAELVSHITDGDYSFFLDGFVIRTDSLRYLSMVLCGGQSSGEVSIPLLSVAGTTAGLSLSRILAGRSGLLQPLRLHRLRRAEHGTRHHRRPNGIREGERRSIHRLSETAGYSRPLLHRHSIRPGDQKRNGRQHRGSQPLLISLVNHRGILHDTTVVIENCSRVNIQLSIVTGIVLVRHCQSISLSVCCERVVVE